MHINGCDARHRRRFALQRDNEIVHSHCRTMNMNMNPLAVICHRYGQGKSMRQSIDKGPEPYPLHQAMDSESPGCCLDFTHGRGQDHRSFDPG
jgi:hypothetical protein